MRRWVVALTVLTAGSPLAAAESCETLEPKAVAALFDDWNFALSSLEASQVVQRYWPNAVLLPTVSNTPRTNAAMIGDYFEHFLARRPRGRVDTRTIQGGCNMAMDAGTYTFSLMDDKGVTSEVAARYTFIYQYRDGGWKILHHHSSAMPESAASAPPVDAHAATPKPQVAPKPAQAARATQSAPAPVPVPVPAASPKQAKVDGKDAPKPADHAVAPAAKQGGSPPTEARTAMFANLASSPPPSKFYPPEAAKHKERGNVNLRVCADDTGAVAGTPEVVKSSGSKLLDEAAQSWARAVKWVPATLNQRRVEGCAQIDVAFEAAV
jgi:uncharacterized protein (TIGR02246 family)